jgi:hypothetical protein
LFIFACGPLASSAQVVIASTDFDSPVNLTSQTILAPTFTSAGDIFDVTTADTQAGAPFDLVDDTDPACPGFFPNDDQGAVACGYPGNFFGIADTENGDNMGPVAAEWVFDISGAGDLTSISIDMAAMGNFEMLSGNTDDFSWSYSIDGGAFVEVFNLDVDMTQTVNYTLTNGTVVSLIDPMVVDGVTLINQFQTLTKAISGSGNELTLRLEGMTNGGDEAIAFDNIVINGLAGGGGPAAIPTMSQWATFLFMLIMVSFGLVFVYKSQTRLAMAEGVSVSANNQTVPFDKSIFQSALKTAMLLAVPGFAIIYMVWGEVVSADFVGMALAIPVVAYLLHMVKLFGKK